MHFTTFFTFIYYGRSLSEIKPDWLIDIMPKQKRPAVIPSNSTNPRFYPGTVGRKFRQRRNLHNSSNSNDMFNQSIDRSICLGGSKINSDRLRRMTHHGHTHASRPTDISRRDRKKRGAICCCNWRTSDFSVTFLTCDCKLTEATFAISTKSFI